MADARSTSSEPAKPRLGPRSKIVIPEAFTKSNSNGRSVGVAPASERTTREKALPLGRAAEPAVVAEVAAPAPADAVVSPKPEPSKPAFEPISPGLSSVKLPLGPSPKDESVSGAFSRVSSAYHIKCTSYRPFTMKRGVDGRHVLRCVAVQSLVLGCSFRANRGHGVLLRLGVSRPSSPLFVGRFF